jgi:3-hydroxyisobutyrate dehydrogenase-like beta-hydroxyacid dehydrogenase
MSSIAPGVARRLAEKAASLGAAMLDAPVSGGDIGAINGTAVHHGRRRRRRPLPPPGRSST